MAKIMFTFVFLLGKGGRMNDKIRLPIIYRLLFTEYLFKNTSILLPQQM